jgi:hypothetical protein
VNRDTRLWQRGQLAAFTDDGRRVVVLRLDDPAARPRLLEGSAAAIWRAMDPPCTAHEVAAAVTVPSDDSGDQPDLEVVAHVERFLLTLGDDGLAEQADHA